METDNDLDNNNDAQQLNLIYEQLFNCYRRQIPSPYARANGPRASWHRPTRPDGGELVAVITPENIERFTFSDEQAMPDLIAPQRSKPAPLYPVNTNIKQMRQERRTEDPSLQSPQPSTSAASLPVNTNIKQMRQERRTEESSLQSPQPSTSAASSLVNANINQMHQRIKTESPISHRERELRCRRRTKVLLSFICKAMMPLSIVENGAFKRFVKDLAPGYRCPSRDTLETEIINQYNSLSQNLKEKLRNKQNLTITLNVWSNTKQTKKFLGITVHYVDSDNLESIVLDFIEIPQSHINPSRIAEYAEPTLKANLQNWSIEANQVIAVITDNAVNITMRGATKLFNYISCFAQTAESIAVNVINKKDELYKKIRLIIKEIIKNPELLCTLRETQDKRAIRRECQKTLVLDNRTEWNSTLHMSEAYLELSPFIKDNEKLKLDPNEMESLREAVEILRLVKELTNELSADHCVTVSEMIPLISCFQSSLNRLQLKTEYGKKLTSLINRQIEKLQKKDESLLYAQATLLDPRYKAIYFTGGFSLLLEKAKKCIIEQGTKGTTTPQSNSDDSNNVDNERDLSNGIWDEHTKRICKRARTSHYDNITINEELSNYLISEIEKDRKQNPFKVWKEYKSLYPNLYTLAQKFLSPVATVLPTERLLSNAASVMMKETNLSNTLLSKIIFLQNLPDKHWDHEQNIEYIDI